MKLSRRLLVLSLAVLLLIGGCAGKNTTGQDIQTFVCDPPADVLNVVNLAEPLVVTALTLAVPGSAVYTQAFEAMGGVSAIQSGVCATVSQINSIIALVTDHNKQIKAGKKGLAPAISVEPLKAWRDKAIKK